GLPQELTPAIQNNSVVITGTPAATALAGVYHPVITVSDWARHTATRQYDLKLDLAVTDKDNLHDGPGLCVMGGQNFRDDFSAKGGSKRYTFSVTSGALPPGLSLTSAGVLSGTLPFTNHLYTFQVTAVDSVDSSRTGSITCRLGVVDATTL